jgi:hypothetical protein
MSREITEIKEPGTLFIPTAKDLFGVAAGGLPNGDDTLTISSTSRGNNTYWARQPAEAGRNFFVPSANTGWSVSFWVKTDAGSFSTASLAVPPAVLFGCWAASSGGAPDSWAASSAFAFAVSPSAAGVNNATLSFYLGGIGQANGNEFGMGGTGTDWRFYVVTVSYNASVYPTVTTYLNGSVHIAHGQRAVDASVQNSSGISSSGYFGIGSVTDDVHVTGSHGSGLIRLSKITMHPVALTHDQVIDMKDSMLYGPLP